VPVHNRTRAAEAAGVTSAREAAFWRIFHHLSGEIAELESDLVRYRELVQLALAQQQQLEAENRRLRRSREAEAEIMGTWQR